MTGRCVITVSLMFCSRDNSTKPCFSCFQLTKCNRVSRSSQRTATLSVFSLQTKKHLWQSRQNMFFPLLLSEKCISSCCIMGLKWQVLLSPYQLTSFCISFYKCKLLYYFNWNVSRIASWNAATHFQGGSSDKKLEMVWKMNENNSKTAQGWCNLLSILKSIISSNQHVFRGVWVHLKFRVFQFIREPRWSSIIELHHHDVSYQTLGTH